MPSKRYRLKLDHPYAEAGTIVEEFERKDDLGRVEVLIPDVQIINIPLDVEHAWLEEVKEEPMFTKEQADALKMKLQAVYGVLYYGSQHTSLVEYIDSHTSK